MSQYNVFHFCFKKLYYQLDETSVLCFLQAKQKTLAVFVLAMMVNEYRNGQVCHTTDEDNVLLFLYHI